MGQEDMDIVPFLDLDPEFARLPELVFSTLGLYYQTNLRTNVLNYFVQFGQDNPEHTHDIMTGISQFQEELSRYTDEPAIDPRDVFGDGIESS